MGIKLFLVLASAASVGACAISPAVSIQQLSKDMAAAEGSQFPHMRTQIQQVDCFDSIHRPIWQREAPCTLDIYSRWVAAPRETAARFDHGTLSADAATAAYKAAGAELWTQVQQKQNEDRKSAEWASNFLEAVLLTSGAFVSGYNQGAGYNQPPAPIVTTSCTALGTTVNCLSQ